MGECTPIEDHISFRSVYAIVVNAAGAWKVSDALSRAYPDIIVPTAGINAATIAHWAQQRKR